MERAALKKFCAEDTLLCYPDYNKMVIIHIDESDNQMGGIINQDKKAVVYWS